MHTLHNVRRCNIQPINGTAHPHYFPGTNGAASGGSELDVGGVYARELDLGGVEPGMLIALPPGVKAMASALRELDAGETSDKQSSPGMDD